MASRQRSRQTCSASSLVSSASSSGGTIPANPHRQDATCTRARPAASPARAGRTKPAVTSELTTAQPTGPNGPESPPSARRGTRAEMMRECLVGGLEDTLDLLVGQRPDLALPGPPAQVLTQPMAAEDVDLPDGGHVPRDPRPVHRHRRADDDRLADRAGQQLGGPLGLPPGGLQPVLLAERPVP